MKNLTAAVAISALVIICSSCQSYDTQRVTYNESGQQTQATREYGGRVIRELSREFETTTLIGEGRIKNSNQGLARRAATQLAVAELAAKVKTRVQANSRIYNSAEVRDVVETKVAALVRNYDIDYAGYEEDFYVVKISMSGQRIVEEFKRELR